MQTTQHHWTFIHVKGHQDDGISDSTETLPYSAQLNIEADRLAGTYTTSSPTDNTTRAPLFEHTGVLLHLRNGTITRHYKAHLRQAAHDPPLLAHLQERQGWTTEEHSSINWQAFKRAHNKPPIPQTHLVKLIPVSYTHLTLPTICSV